VGLLICKFVDRSRRSIAEKNSQPTFQGHPAAMGSLGGFHQKSAFTQPFNLIETGSSNPAECNIVQNSQIAHVQIPLEPRSLQTACKFDHNGQSAEEEGKKDEFNLHDAPPGA
jgi:hypothetical protein